MKLSHDANGLASGGVFRVDVAHPPGTLCSPGWMSWPSSQRSVAVTSVTPKKSCGA